ncbi:MAG: hypothetical protein OXB86_06085, partial [Bdellovibrionales bacterium]|nr:hypothetical protein [Bdellovibrionales bacterium]
KPLLITLILAFLISDILLLESHKLIVPEKALPPLKLSPVSRLSPSQNYEVIWKENIFHTGPIPTSLMAEEESSVMVPVKTSLPLTLKGTIVHANPHRSVATVKDQKKTHSYKVDDVIDKQAKVTEILRKKIIFLNLNNNLLEFLALPESIPVTLTLSQPRRQDPVKAGLVKKSGNTFEVKRSRINEYLQRLPEILQQAKMVPHRVTRNGETFIEGFKFVAIKEEAQWLQDLDFQKGDIIKKVDGEPVNTPETAIELFEKLRDSDGFEMVVNRNGRDFKRKYTVDWDSQ